MAFSSFAGTRVLAFFLANPTRKIHFKELCRELELSPSSVKLYCEDFITRKWLTEHRIGNHRFFQLDNSSYPVLAIKRAYFLELLSSNGADKVVRGTAISLALYGSHASGEYDEKSDIDLLVIGRKDDIVNTTISRIERAAGKPVQLTVISLDMWESGLKSSDPFVISVLRNHVLLMGARL